MHFPLERKVLFVYNPKSGKAKIRNKLADILDIFTAGGYEVTVYPTGKKGDAVEIVANRRPIYDLVVCSGGDGTLDEVVTGMMRSSFRTPIGYIPAGSTNDFGGSLELSKNMVTAAKQIMKGKSFPCDIGAFNQDIFVYIAAFGIFTEVSYETGQDIKNVLGHMAYVLEGIKSVASLSSYHLKITYDDNVIEDDFFLGMITNSLTVGGFPNPNSKIAKLDDGLYEALLVKYPTSPLDLQATVTAYLMGEFNPEYMYQFTAKKITVESPEAIQWTLDGEFGGSVTYAEIENMHNALNIIRK